MNSADERLKELDSLSLTSDERALVRCRVAAEFIDRGQYEDARETLGDLWQGVGQRPNTEGLSERVAAEVLLLAGALSGWLGASRRAPGAQADAKDLISGSVSLFESLGEAELAAAAQSELALCYWREGAYAEAHVLLTSALGGLSDVVRRAKAVLRLTTVEFSDGRYHDALNILKDNAVIFDDRVSHALRGNFHNLLALALKQLGTMEGRPDYLDRAVIEYTAAIYHLERAGHERYHATNENNLAMLLYRLGRHREAHEHLDRAGATVLRLKDAGLLAQVDETRARVFLAEKKYSEADRVITRAVQALEGGGTAALLSEALTTQGATLARLGRNAAARASFARASELAERAGYLEGAGLAKLSMLEELRDHLSYQEARALYISADSVLSDTRHLDSIARLRVAARLLLGVHNEKKAGVGPSLVVSFDDFPREVRTYCEQYLLYFIQFLQDLGIEATPELRHEAGQVLFTVTPTNQQEALEKIWAALKVYLYLPSNPVSSSVSNEIAVKRLEYAVTGLQRELRLAEAELQAKNATIEAQQLTINVQKGLLSGEIVINSQRGATQKTTGEDREEIFNGVAALTVLKKSGVEINLAKIFRWLKEKFIERD